MICIRKYKHIKLMENNIILSICIPTFNRAEYLEQTILSIVKQKRFLETTEVEIIISDNCSSDITQKVSLSFVEMYGEKIKYFRNDSNIKDLNFEKALSYGQGIFLKLNNDTLKHQEGSLDNILQTIAENKEDKNILFFSNGVLDLKHNTKCNSLNSFVDVVSYYSGWIASFGIWKEDYLVFNDFNRCSHLQLTQVDVLFRLINTRRSVFVNNNILFTSIPPSVKGGYDLLTVFLDNYIFLLTEQLNTQTLSKKIFVLEKRKLLLKFIRPWMINIKTNPNGYNFECKNSFKRIFSYYKSDILTLLIFYVSYNYLRFHSLAKKIYMLKNA